MELFKRINVVYMFVIMKNDVTNAYLGCKIVATQKQLIGISSVIYEISGRST
jgi:hypothetical protein